MLSAITLLTACETTSYVQHYKQEAPRTYAETDNVYLFNYQNIDIDEIYEMFYYDYLIIGRTSFNGPYQNPLLTRDFAKEIGSDVFLTTYQFDKNKTYFSNWVLPTVNTTNISGSNGFSATATSYGTTVVSSAHEVTLYNQDALFLKKMNTEPDFWERSASYYPETSASPYTANWVSNDYNLTVYESNGLIVGIANDVSSAVRAPFVLLNLKVPKPKWNKGDIKLVFDFKSSKGVFLLDDKTPTPAKFKINRFNHLEVTTLTAYEKVSFEKSISQ